MADIAKLRKNLEARGYESSFFETEAEAADYLAEQISGERLAIGGSMTAAALHLGERLGEKNTLIWHQTAEDKDAALREAMTADVYISGANAVSEAGEIVNIDGTGNRIAGTLYGRKKVYIIIGVNKITPDLESAVRRARNVAAPLNARRLGLSTPCVSSGELRCFDCRHPQRICRGLLILWEKMNGVGACEVVIINKSLGY